MKKNIAIAGFIIVLGLFLTFVWLVPSIQPPAPDVSFRDLQGNNFSLAQFKDKAVVVNFWSTTCPICITEIPVLTALAQKLTKQDVVIIGVAMNYDPEPQVREMVYQKNINYPVVLDHSGKLAKAFGEVTMTPTTFFINKQGTIVKQRMGDIPLSELESTIQGLIL